MAKSKEESAAKQRIANAKAQVRKMMIAGKTDEARAYAEKYGFDVFAARLGPEYQNSAEPMFAALKAARNGAATPVVEAAVDVAPAVMDMGDEPVPEAAPDSPESINGYPVLTDAVVWGIPPNKNLVVIELPDKRRVSMWRTRRVTYRIYMKLRARLVKTEGDPIYEEVMPAQAAF